MENAKPLVSVIIPVFNAQRYIKLALDSICTQSYRNLEIIVIDDGSTDQSKKIIENYNDDRIRFFSRENLGLISTLNEGIDRSTGDYIARMDADDVCLHDRLNRQIDFLRSNDQVGVAFTGIELLDETGNIMRSKVSKKARSIEPVELLFGCPLCHPTAMFDMTKLNKNDIYYDADYHLAEDFELWTRLISKTKIGLLNEVLFGYRIHSNSITSQNGDKQRKVASQAIYRNLAPKSSKAILSSLGVVYNNHLGNESLYKTTLSLLHVGSKLKSLNGSFSYRKYLSKSYYLLRNKIRSSKHSSLRS